MLSKRCVFAVGALFAGANADCDGQPCQLLSVATPTRLQEEESEPDVPVNLGVNTFTAVDQCANSEVSRLTNWVLDYYADVSTQLDQSFSNILQIGRLAASALTHLSALSAELQAYQRSANITSEMNAMLRVCLADYSALTNSMLKCPMAFDANAAQPMGNLTNVDGAALLTERLDLNGTCMELLCEHVQSFKASCGDEGFTRDLAELASAHELEGTSSRYLSKRDSTFVSAPVHFLYTPEDDSSNYAQQAEDLLTQEYALMTRVNLVIDLWMRWMFVTVRKNLRGSVWEGASDAHICSKLGFDPPEPYYHLVVKLQGCMGNFKIRDILIKHKQSKVIPYIREMLEAMDKALDGKARDENDIVNAGMMTNICAMWTQDYEPKINALIKEMEEQNAAQGLSGGDENLANLGGGKLYGGDVASVGDFAASAAFGEDTGPTQTFGMKIPGFGGNDNVMGL